MSKKTKSSSTTTPILPGWLTSGVQDAAGRVSQIGRMDPYSLVAGSNPLIDRAAALAQGLGGAYPTGGLLTLAAQDPARAASVPRDPETGAVVGAADPTLWDYAVDGLTGPWYAELMGSSAPSAAAASGTEYLDRWFNPYLDDVVGRTLAQYDEDAGRARAAQTLRMAGSNAFPGSGAALAAGEAERQRIAQRGMLDATLRQQGWNTAAGFAGQDADRFTNVSMRNADLDAQHRALKAQTALGRAAAFGNLAAGYGQDQRADIGLLGDIGESLRGMEQQRLLAPVSLAQAEAGLLGNLPLGLFRGEQTTGTTKESDPLGSLTSILSTAAKLGWAPLA